MATTTKRVKLLDDEAEVLGWYSPLVALAMASTLAGNFTVLGSVANLIVVERARGLGVNIGFWDYFRVGAPLTLVTLLVGIAWLW